MSIKKEYKTITHEVTEAVEVNRTLVCDICGKEIEKRGDYWELTTGHHDWGRDSIDSIDKFDICSAECLTKKYNEYLERTINHRNTEYFEVIKTTNVIF